VSGLAVNVLLLTTHRAPSETCRKRSQDNQMALKTSTDMIEENDTTSFSTFPRQMMYAHKLYMTIRSAIAVIALVAGMQDKV